MASAEFTEERALQLAQVPTILCYSPKGAKGSDAFYYMCLRSHFLCKERKMALLEIGIKRHRLEGGVSREKWKPAS